ncbi:MAG: dihydroorotate dehydrogenase electron transfer subunit [Vicinamibacterales bacterium]
MLIDVEAAVIANTRLSDEYNVLALDASAIARDALPGQFAMVKPAPGNDPLLRRPFSIFEILRDGGGRPIGMSILNKRVGVGSRLLFDAVPGSRVPCLGPLGRPFLATGSADVAAGEAWMVAGGVGLAPFATVAEALAARCVPATLFYGGRRSADLFYVEFFERLGVRVVLATEDGSRGERGRVTVPLERALAATPPDRAVTLYVCGPTPMMAAAASLARRHGRRAVASLEQVMGCGLGGCYSCVVQVRRNGSVHFVRSCIDGPVFDAEEIVWEELTH